MQFAIHLHKFHTDIYKVAEEVYVFPGDVSVGIKCDARVISDEEEDIDFDIIPNANDTFTVKYMPPGAGRYTIKVLFAGEVSALWCCGT